MSKYKIGDRVLIKNNLKAYKQYGSEFVVPNMLDMRGKIATIGDIAKTDDTKYLLKGYNQRRWFTNEMILGLEGEASFEDEDMTDIPLTEEEEKVKAFMENEDDGYTLQDFIDEISDSIECYVDWDKVIEDTTKEIINKYTEYTEGNENTESKYKVGDIVRIKEGLKENCYYGTNTVNSEMMELLGKEVIIERIIDYSNMLIGHGVEYKIVGNDFHWTDEMIACKIGEFKGELGEKQEFDIDGRLIAYGKDVEYMFRTWCIENDIIFEEYK